jgi:hypothetical protein
MPVCPAMCLHLFAELVLEIAIATFAPTTCPFDAWRPRIHFGTWLCFGYESRFWVCPHMQVTLTDLMSISLGSHPPCKGI